jgi:hypothetical protein
MTRMERNTGVNSFQNDRMTVTSVMYCLSSNDVGEDGLCLTGTKGHANWYKSTITDMHFVPALRMTLIAFVLLIYYSGQKIIKTFVSSKDFL